MLLPFRVGSWSCPKSVALAIIERESTPAIVVTPSICWQQSEKHSATTSWPTSSSRLTQIKSSRPFKDENVDFRQSLADRRIIERADGILIGHLNISEEQALNELRNTSQAKRMKLVKITEAEVDSTEIHSQQ